jgi:methyl-accepting chemotaxis protein
MHALRTRMLLALVAAVAPLPLALAAWMLEPRATLAALAAGTAVCATAAFMLLRAARAAAARAFEEAQEARRRLAAAVDQAARAEAATTARSGEAASENRALSERLQAQAAELERAREGLEGLAESLRRNTDSARATQGLVAEARGATDRAIEAATQVIGRMESIREATAKVADIVGLIDAIAFQTNILALNAAVEAARAGEHGRGFAVVAAEVRALSQRAASSAHEIKDLVTSANAQVAESSGVVDQVAESIAAVNGRIAEVDRLMGAMVAGEARAGPGPARSRPLALVPSKRR